MSIDNLNGKKLFASWSGGKDSCLALCRAIKAGGVPSALLTTLTGDGSRSRSHGLAQEVIAAQSRLLDIESKTCQTSWDDYEERFVETVTQLARAGVKDGIFGDIDLEPHREWVEKVCARCGVTPHLPLWLEERRRLLDDFIESGFTAMIVAVRDERLDRSFLGRIIDHPLIDALETAGVDACGEEGEFHTVVVNGPLFKKPLGLIKGEMITHDGYTFLDLKVA